MGQCRGQGQPRVGPGGPGAQAGLKVDDVIVAFEGVIGAGPNRLSWLTSIAGVGKKVHLKVERSKTTLFPTIVLGPLPDAAEER